MHSQSQLRAHEKGVVLQEIRIFSAKPIKVRECYALLMRILYMCMHEEQITKKEATSIFFGVTKLFQCKDVSLRRMVYLVLKMLAKYSDDVIIAIAILSKDLVNEKIMLRANALRVISRVVDASVLTQIERFIKQSIVDKDYYVSSSALVSAIHLSRHCPEVVSKWAWEIQESMSFPSCMVQYHALILLCWIKRHDRVASMKMVQMFPPHRIYPFLGYCYLIRICGRLLTEQINQQEVKNASDSPLFVYMEAALRYGSDVVMFEGARRICAQPKLQFKEVRLALMTLVGFLTSAKITVRFAAVRAIYQLALQEPKFIDSTCCCELRGLIDDSNWNTSLLAILTLLQCEKEEEIPKVLREIRGFMTARSSSHVRAEVIEGIQRLSAKYPSQYVSIFSFLSKALHDGMGFDCNRRIVDIFMEMIDRNPEISEYALGYLCEYIEDCEHEYLLIKILNFLGIEGPKMNNLAIFIRYIYNRMILEGPVVKVSALVALVKFRNRDLDKVKALLSWLVKDVDAYISYRVSFFLNVLSIQEQEHKQVDHLLLSNSPAIYAAIHPSLAGDQYGALQHIASASEEYLLDKTQQNSGPLELSDTTLLAAPMPVPRQVGAKSMMQHMPSNRAPIKTTTAVKSDLLTPKTSDQIAAMFPSHHSLDHFKTSQPIHLTEPDVEYQIVYFKHIFNRGRVVILQFNIISTLTDLVSKDLSISLDPLSVNNSNSYQVSESLPYEPILKTSTPQCSHVANTYLLLIVDPCHGSTDDHPAWSTEQCSYQTILHLQSMNVDPHTSEPLEGSSFCDEYALDELTFTLLDYLKPATPPSPYDQLWSSMEADKTTCSDSVVTFAISHLHTLQSAIDYLVQMLGLQPCDSTEFVSPKSNRHALKLFGLFIDMDTRILARARMRLNSSNQEKSLSQGVSVQLCILANDLRIPSALTSTVLKW